MDGLERVCFRPHGLRSGSIATSSKVRIATVQLFICPEFVLDTLGASLGTAFDE